MLIESTTGQVTITDAAVGNNSGAYVVTATADNTSPAYTDGTSATKTITVTVSYNIGATGPASGKIFYINTDSSLAWTYLEAATSDESAQHPWGNTGTPVAGTLPDIGAGAANTALIVAALGSTDSYAAKICDDSTIGGKDDWFLPSKDELNELYKERDAVGGFALINYWSSSEYDATNAWIQNFGNSYYQGGSSKNSNKSLRIVRAF